MILKKDSSFDNVVLTNDNKLIFLNNADFKLFVCSIHEFEKNKLLKEIQSFH